MIAYKPIVKAALLESGNASHTHLYVREDKHLLSPAHRKTMAATTASSPAMERRGSAGTKASSSVQVRLNILTTNTGELFCV